MKSQIKFQQFCFSNANVLDKRANSCVFAILDVGGLGMLSVAPLDAPASRGRLIRGTGF